MYKRRLAALLLLLVMFFTCTSAAEEAAAPKRVFMADETAPFGDDEQLLTIRVCTLTGADCMLVTYGDLTMLVDAGKAIDYPTIKAMLDAQGVEKLDILFHTHPHSDHIGSVAKIVESGMPIGQFMTLFPHDYTGNSIVQRSSIAALEAAGIPIVDVEDGDKVPFGDADITVMRQHKADSDNDLSAMLMVKMGDTSVLLTGDVEYIAQWYLVRAHDLKADIMKYPHHAVSRINPEFLDAVQPEFCFITHGSRDTATAQKQLTMAGIPFKFATWGEITMQTNGEKWIVDQAD